MSTYKIAVVVDEAFGERLVGIAKLIHVWVCDTPVNRQAAETVNAHLMPEGVWNEQGVTTFHFSVNLLGCHSPKLASFPCLCPDPV